MAKFRSWSEEFKSFSYWENGNYFRIKNNKREYYESNPCAIVSFDWENAEPSFTADNKTFFDKDIISFMAHRLNPYTYEREDYLEFKAILILDKKTNMWSLDLNNEHNREKLAPIGRQKTERLFDPFGYPCLQLWSRRHHPSLNIIALKFDKDDGLNVFGAYYNVIGNIHEDKEMLK